MTAAPRRFLVVNQHGENRGDEAALRAMIRAIDARYPGSSFVVLAQARGRGLQLSFGAHDVRLESLLLPPAQALGLAAYGALAAIGLRPSFLLTGRARGVIDGYRQADVVITAPGGPYFGDIYAGHELVHWFFVYLARAHGAPVFQYAPSCGPFRRPVLNWLRRRFYGWIDVLVVREEISREHLVSLLGPGVPVHVAADAAIQDRIRPASRAEYFAGARAHLRDRFLVAVTLQRYRFPGDPDPPARQAAYERAVLACLERLAEARQAHFLFVPQLYGSVHSDVPFHRYLGGRLPAGVSWEVVDPDLDSDGQRAVVGMTDFCVASRYHPQIFATTQGVPGLFVWYEHKQLGYLRSLGLEAFAFDIRRPDAAGMLAALDDALARREAIAAAIRERLPVVRRLAATTTDRLEALVEGRRAPEAVAARAAIPS